MNKVETQLQLIPAITQEVLKCIDSSKLKSVELKDGDILVVTIDKDVTPMVETLVTKVVNQMISNLKVKALGLVVREGYFQVQVSKVATQLKEFSEKMTEARKAAEAFFQEIEAMSALLYRWKKWVETQEGNNGSPDDKKSS